MEISSVELLIILHFFMVLALAKSLYVLSTIDTKYMVGACWLTFEMYIFATGALTSYDGFNDVDGLQPLNIIYFLHIFYIGIMAKIFFSIKPTAINTRLIVASIFLFMEVYLLATGAISIEMYQLF